MEIRVYEPLVEEHQFVEGGIYTEKPLEDIDASVVPVTWILVRERYTDKFVWVNCACQYATNPMSKEEATTFAKGLYYQPNGAVMLKRPVHLRNGVSLDGKTVMVR